MVPIDPHLIITATDKQNIWSGKKRLVSRKNSSKRLVNVVLF